MLTPTKKQHADPSGTSLPEFVHIPTANGGKGFKDPCPIGQTRPHMMADDLRTTAQEAATTTDHLQAGHSSADLFCPYDLVSANWPASCRTPKEPRTSGCELEVIDAARTVLMGKLPAQWFRADLRDSDPTRGLFLTPASAVQPLSLGFNRTGLVGWPLDAEHLNAPDQTEYPGGRDRADQDWDAVRRLYADAAEEAIGNLIDFANYGPIRNNRLTARICAAIHDELADLSREFSDTFELEDRAKRQSRPDE